MKTRAVRMYGKEDLRLEEFELPKLKDDEIFVKFVSNEEKFKCKGLKVKAHSTVGAGDAMVAAISYGVEKGLCYREAAKLGVATSAGAVTTIGTKPPTREVVDELLVQVECEEI